MNQTTNGWTRWLQEHEQFFSFKLNGYSKIPFNIYSTILPLIDRDGSIIDLGCGNGILLKFIMLFSGHSLIPFGIDISESAIYQAKSTIHTKYANNFKVQNMIHYAFDKRRYDIIITSLAQGISLRDFTLKCIKQLNKNGRLIYILHADVLTRYNINTSTIFNFNGLKIRVSNGGGGIKFFIYDK
jgi:2-polyprenyl-3-methyl-5-hydroxy-6-metoxy-1,4-benzoquinol methylase